MTLRVGRLRYSDLTTSLLRFDDFVNQIWRLRFFSFFLSAVAVARTSTVYWSDRVHNIPPYIVLRGTPLQNRLWAVVQLFWGSSIRASALRPRTWFVDFRILLDFLSLNNPVLQASSHLGTAEMADIPCRAGTQANSIVHTVCTDMPTFWSMFNTKMISVRRAFRDIIRSPFLLVARCKPVVPPDMEKSHLAFAFYDSPSFVGSFEMIELLVLCRLIHCPWDGAKASSIVSWICIPHILLKIDGKFMAVLLSFSYKICSLLCRFSSGGCNFLHLNNIMSSNKWSLVTRAISYHWTWPNTIQMM